jgi:hypothetical protein
MTIPRVLMVGERLTGTKELLFFDGRRGYRTDLDWYFDKSLAAAWKLNFKSKLAFYNLIIKNMKLSYLRDDERSQDNSEDLHVHNILMIKSNKCALVSYFNCP